MLYKRWFKSIFHRTPAYSRLLYIQRVRCKWHQIWMDAIENDYDIIVANVENSSVRALGRLIWAAFLSLAPSLFSSKSVCTRMHKMANWIELQFEMCVILCEYVQLKWKKKFFVIHTLDKWGWNENWKFEHRPH